jgi:hypothetical protein
VDGDRIALISERAIYLITGASMRLLAQVPTDDKNFSRPPSAMLLSGSALWIGYDHGEFGGGLYRLDINQSSPVLMHMLDDRVRFLAKSKAGRIWAAAGISHLGGVDGAVYRIGDDGSPQSVASISGYGDYQGGRSKIEEQSGVPFPGLSAVAGLAFTSDDDPIVVLPEFGVFALETDHFEALYRGTLECANRRCKSVRRSVYRQPLAGRVAAYVE